MTPCRAPSPRSARAPGRRRSPRSKRQRAEANLEASLAFLAANAEKEGVKTLASGLQYKELSAGEGKTPEVTVG